MGTGLTGQHGVLAAQLVEEEIKPKQEIALIQHHQMEGKIVVSLMLTLQPRFAITSLAQQVISLFYNFYNYRV